MANMNIKKITGFGLPFVLIHFICCGALLFWLIGSGYLLAMSNEGRNKVFLIPILIISGTMIFLYRYHSKCCREKGEKTIKDYLFQFLLYSSPTNILILLAKKVALRSK